MSRIAVTVNDKNLELSNLDKIFWPDKGLTKSDLIKFYIDIAQWILPHLQHRPVVMKRYPDGIRGKSFYQKRCPEYAPDWMERVFVEGEGDGITYCTCNDAAALAWFINQGCIELHPWLSSVDSLEHPDFLVIDLDPSEGNTFNQVLETARGVKESLDLCELVGYPKTSGISGIHIYVPLEKKYTYQQVRKAANHVADLVCANVPELATVERVVRNRGKKIYVDYLQNGAGKTIASVYSLRPVEAASVSMPITWEEIFSGEITPEMFTFDSVLQRLNEKGDIFLPVLTEAYSLDHLLA